MCRLPPSLLRFGPRSVDLSAGRITSPAGAEPLTPTERAVLERLAASAGCPVATEDLLRDVWGYSEAANTRTIAMMFSRLRKRLEPDPARPRYLLTVHNVGYQLASEASAPPRDDTIVGREAEREQIDRWLESGTARWLTLVGPGGIGKSALLGLVGRSIRPGRFAGGVLRVSAEDPGALAERLDRALDVSDALVLVDLEDLDPSAILGAATRPPPTTRVIAAAREALDVRGEGILRVRALSPTASLVLLGADRARLADATFGLPLALHLATLAAPPAPDIGAADWLESLEDPVAAPRHRTLAANRASTRNRLPDDAFAPGWDRSPVALDALARGGLLDWTDGGLPRRAPWVAG